MTDLTEMNRKK